MKLKVIIRKLQGVLKIIENPKLLSLKRAGGYINLYSSLDKTWFHRLRIETVLDIGANRGQFALTIKSLLPQCQVYSFEPIPDCVNEMKTRLKNTEKFTFFNVGLGNCSGELEFERNNFSPSSSFLKVTQKHQELFPFTSNVQPITVKIERLDDFIDRNLLEVKTPLLIKIDVQGYEKQVLLGASKTIQKASLIILETSFEELYEGQPLFKEIYTQLIDLGFIYGGSLEQMYSPDTGKILQADSLFFNASVRI
jgi:FkbM family methyltransferase